MTLKTQFHFLAPVEVVKVTTHNIDEVAEWCGGKVAETESRRVPGRMDKYVWVPTPKGTNISWAFPGMFITKRVVVTLKNELKATYSVFRRDYFEKNYFDTPNAAVDATWARKDSGVNTSPAKGGPVINVRVEGAEEMQRQIEQVKTEIRQMAEAAGIDLDSDEEQAVVNVHAGLGIKSIEMQEKAPKEEHEDLSQEVHTEKEEPEVAEAMEAVPDAAEMLQKAKELIIGGFAAGDEIETMTQEQILEAHKQMTHEQRRNAPVEEVTEANMEESPVEEDSEAIRG